MISRANCSIDMCHGPLLGKIVRFVIPLMAANMMQCLFSAVDLIVIGRYASADAMAAVGSSGPLISAILSVFFGLSVGGNVLVATNGTFVMEGGRIEGGSAMTTGWHTGGNITN